MNSPSDRKPGLSGNQSKGHRHETLAATYLEQHGFTILERNWRTGHKEIDLIARTETVLVFVEVKAAGGGSFGHPAERVDSKKRANLLVAARQYVVQKEVTGLDLRFDVITFQGGRLEHFPDAFQDEA
jgi:putative endonuclease